jgi:hypothetical protein
VTPRNYEARRYENESQARELADWCNAGLARGGAGEILIVPARPPRAGRKQASPGNWIVVLSDGSVEVDEDSGQAGYCTDCGLPLWWEGHHLVTRAGSRWCAGDGGWRQTRERHHALPGMVQWAVQDGEGRVCSCTARKDPHIHQIVPAGKEDGRG